MSYLIGSSPRVRGTLASAISMAFAERFIPAGAGNAAASAPRCRASSVHPRGCGERPMASRSYRGCTGSSPRVRGTLVSTSRREARPRFIPAGAGNASARTRLSGSRSVHPRGCGERALYRSLIDQVCGSSPRVRGTLWPTMRRRPPRRFIPAGAGNAARSRRTARPHTVHPRGCGERVWPSSATRRFTGSSPRVRGTRGGRHARRASRRFIPAGAGNALRAGR